MLPSETVFNNQLGAEAQTLYWPFSSSNSLTHLSFTYSSTPVSCFNHPNSFCSFFYRAGSKTDMTKMMNRRNSFNEKIHRCLGYFVPHYPYFFPWELEASNVIRSWEILTRSIGVPHKFLFSRGKGFTAAYILHCFLFLQTQNFHLAQFSHTILWAMFI